MTPSGHQIDLTPRDRVLLCIQTFVAAAAAGAAVVAGVAAGLYQLMEPECSGTEWILCGLEELLVSLAIGTLVGLVAFVWVACKMIAGAAPRGDRLRLVLVVTIAIPIGVAAMFLFLGVVG